jgi:alanine racemase
MTKSQRIGTLSLLYKKGDSRQLKNWRPVSLLNVDYKILSKIMTARLKGVMARITPSAQKCGVPGRKAMDVIMAVDIIQGELVTTGGALVCLDQEKAFDRVNHTYLVMLLQKL